MRGNGLWSLARLASWVVLAGVLLGGPNRGRRVALVLAPLGVAWVLRRVLLLLPILGPSELREAVLTAGGLFALGLAFLTAVLERTVEHATKKRWFVGIALMLASGIGGWLALHGFHFAETSIVILVLFGMGTAIVLPSLGLSARTQRKRPRPARYYWALLGLCCGFGVFLLCAFVGVVSLFQGAYMPGVMEVLLQAVTIGLILGLFVFLLALPFAISLRISSRIAAARKEEPILTPDTKGGSPDVVDRGLGGLAVPDPILKKEVVEE